MADTPPAQAKSFDQIVREVGTYSPAAFQFVRDGLTAASERVHGPVSKTMSKIFRWMAKYELTPDDVQRLAEAGRLPLKVRAAIENVGGTPALNRHVTGPQLCDALRDVALERWGPLADVVLAHWGIYGTADFGRIVFVLVDNGVLSKQPTDAVSDFDRVYEFRKVFGRRYRIQLG
jgi:uncharacterized repeat protein (TIGR04138 family)